MLRMLIFTGHGRNLLPALCVGHADTFGHVAPSAHSVPTCCQPSPPAVFRYLPLSRAGGVLRSSRILPAKLKRICWGVGVLTPASRPWHVSVKRIACSNKSC